MAGLRIGIFTEWEELHGDATSRDPADRQRHRTAEGRACAVIGRKKAAIPRNASTANFRSPRPEGYRKACAS